MTYWVEYSMLSHDRRPYDTLDEARRRARGLFWNKYHCYTTDPMPVRGIAIYRSATGKTPIGYVEGWDYEDTKRSDYHWNVYKDNKKTVYNLNKDGSIKRS